MYCPRCGRQPIADALRFCSYCGFKLGVVKASLDDDDDLQGKESSMQQTPPKALRQRDINIGVILMFVGALLATLLAGRGIGLGREGGALILTVVFSTILLFSRPIMKLIYRLLSWEEPPAHSFSVNQRRMVFGSMLMFASTILLAISSLLMFGRMRTAEFFFGLVAAFVLLLTLSKHLMRALRYLIASDEDVLVVSQTGVATDSVSIGDSASNAALTAVQSIPVSLYTSPRVTTGEIVAPASVTEHTTNLLENK
jgi:hypothetical protein